MVVGPPCDLLYSIAAQNSSRSLSFFHFFFTFGYRPALIHLSFSSYLSYLSIHTHKHMYLQRQSSAHHKEF